MKKITIVLVLLLTAACTTNNNLCTDFENYRFNPFQFPYPEYYMKAKVIDIDKLHSPSRDGQTKINFFGLSAVISKEWFSNQDISADGKTITFLIDNEKSFFLYQDSEQLMGCALPESREANKDFCSAFNSTKEYYEKLYMLTPDDLRKKEYAAKGNSWIVHQKGSWFAAPRQVTAIYKYEGNDFVAYRRDFKTDKSGDKTVTSEVVIFHKINAPNAIVIGSLVEKNDELFRQLLTTLK